MGPSECLEKFKAYVREFKDWDRFERLRRFLEFNDPAQEVKISILTLKLNGSQEAPFECDGYTKLDHFLTKSPLQPGACRLFLIENICPETAALLHERFDIELDVFAKHVDNEPWFRAHDVASCIPELPSSQNRQNFLQIRHIETLSVYEKCNPGTPPSGDVLDSSEHLSFNNFDVWGERSDGETKSFRKLGHYWRLPDKGSTRVPRPAEKLTRQSRPKTAGFEERKFCPVLWARHVTTIWFKQNEIGGWFGVVLLDPIFKATLAGRNGKPCLLRHPEIYDCNLPSRNNDGTSSPKSSLMIIADSWRKLDQIQRKTAISDCFAILHPIYSLVAHEWNIFNTYMLQELHTIEFKLELTEPAFSDLEVHLKHLYAHRRRCTKYFELITEAKEQCKTSGQISWHSQHSLQKSKISQELEKDFERLRSDTQSMETRIDKNIDLLTALINIGGGKQSLNESKGISRLSFFATIFIPASTVATVLGIEQPFAPGSSRFWIFWAVAVPLTITAIGIVFAMSIRNYVLGLVNSSLSVARKRKPETSKV